MWEAIVSDYLLENIQVICMIKPQMKITWLA